jgi:hypothetical protein
MTPAVPSRARSWRACCSAVRRALRRHERPGQPAPYAEVGLANAPKKHGLLWDFIGAEPRIVAVLFSSKLNASDWGRIIQPIEGGGRTIRVSIMKARGVYKMVAGWLPVHNADPRAA